LLGYGREEILGKSVEVLIPEASKEIHVQHRNRYMEEPRIRQMGAGMNLMARHKKGREFKVQIMLAPIMVPKTGLYALATIRRAS
jgi:PAS domain S-box-containing protein